MRVPLEWLAAWIDLPPEAELVERLEMGGFEDVAVLRDGPDLSAIRVGHVLERRAHPGADRLSLCRVDVGLGEPVEVVCGAPNVAAGQKVAVALPGTQLPDGTKLGRAKIRGVVSNGMICSSRELGLGDEHAGILVLDPQSRVGAPLPEAIGASPGVLELGITPNRGDAASLLGLAREVRTHFGGEIRLPPCEPPERGAAAAAAARVRIEAPDACHRYVGRVVRGVRVGESPAWLRQRLEAAGLRAINNVVDVTNLVLLELGQPLHAFDLAKLRGGEIRVRRAAAGEKLETLDGAVRELDPRDLAIADAERPVALAGVMGGAGSEVSAETRDVLIESAHFDPATVRLAARRHGLRTEASYRFERGVDRAGVRRAADRAARLLAELAGGEVAPDAVEAVGEPPPAPGELRLEVERANRLLGTSLSAAQMRECLERAGIACRDAGGGVLAATVPSHRNDLWLAEDLIEEVARIHGYDRIPATDPVAVLAPGSVPAGWELGERARDALAAAGLCEAVCFPFLAPAELAKLGFPGGDRRARPLRLQNPIREEEPCLRTTLVPSLLALARQNLARQAERVRLFEVSRVFLPGAPGELPEEPLQAAALVTAPTGPRLWEPRPGPPLFFELKGVAESLFVALGYRPETAPGEPPPYLHPGAAAELRVGGRVIGALGEIDPAVAAAFEIDAPCALFEVDLGALQGIAPLRPGYREVSRYPLVRRDLAVIVDGEVPAGEVLAAIRETGGAHLAAAEVFDRYQGPGVPEGRQSLAFRLVFQRADRTLTDEEVSAAVDRVVRTLERRFGGKLR
jgi:phenylalanyl-tRNA synthetase beta chain